MKTKTHTNAGTGFRRLKTLVLKLAIAAAGPLFCNCGLMDSADFGTMTNSMLDTAMSTGSPSPSSSYNSSSFGSSDSYGGGEAAVINSLQNQIQNLAASDTVTPEMEAETFGTILGIMASGF